MGGLIGFVAWIIFGALSGWVTARIMHLKTEFWGNTLIGIAGAILGGALVTLIGGAGITGFNIYSLIVAIMGGCAFTWLVRKINHDGGRK